MARELQQATVVFKRHLKLVRWFIGTSGGILIGLWIAIGALSRAPLLREKLVETLSEQLDADVELARFDVKTFPLTVIAQSLSVAPPAQFALTLTACPETNTRSPVINP